MYEINDELLKQLLDAHSIINTAPAEFVVDCKIDSLRDKQTRKLLASINKAERMLNSFIGTVFLDKLLEIKVENELVAI